MTIDEFNHWLDDPRRSALVMGILNVTPDSFSDGGKFIDADAAAERARQMVDAGADIIDIGGESTRPGALPVESTEQIRRLLPALKKIVAMNLAAVISVDSAQSSVASAALDAGAHMINDVSAGRDDARIFPLAASRKCPIILMHMLGRPRTMQNNPVYSDVVQEVRDFLAERINSARQQGVSDRQIIIDPGIGFGKTFQHDLILLHRLKAFAELDKPVMVGVSRKKFIGKVTGEPEPGQRTFGTVAAVAWSVANGAHIVRVHDVKATSQAVKMIAAIQAENENAT